jgi:hypothetical protein
MNENYLTVPEVIILSPVKYDVPYSITKIQDIILYYASLSAPTVPDSSGLPARFIHRHFPIGQIV